MDILNITYIITGLSTGGAEMMLYKVLKNIDTNRFSTHVISLTTKGEIGKRIEALGIPVEALGITPGQPDPIKFLKLVKRLRALCPDLVHTWLYHADLMGGLAARLAGVKNISWSIRHSDLSTEHNKYSTLLVVRICALLSKWVPRKILCCSNVAKTVHADTGYDFNKLVVIPNGFELNRFVPDPLARDSVRAELHLSADTRLVGLIARFDLQKNHSGFFESAARVHLQQPDVNFLLAGTNIEKSNAELYRMVELAGLESTTHLLGRRADIPRLLAGLDVLVSSSHGEAFPNVLGEAMACGVPCAVTDVGDSAEIVGNTGRVVKSDDMKGLSLAMEELLALSISTRQALGKKARSRICELYDIHEVVKQYERFYEDLVCERDNENEIVGP